jgi:hypothetical protein
MNVLKCHACRSGVVPPMSFNAFVSLPWRGALFYVFVLCFIQYLNFQIFCIFGIFFFQTCNLAILVLVSCFPISQPHKSQSIYRYRVLRLHIHHKHMFCHNLRRSRLEKIQESKPQITSQD